MKFSLLWPTVLVAGYLLALPAGAWGQSGSVDGVSEIQPAKAQPSADSADEQTAPLSPENQTPQSTDEAAATSQAASPEGNAGFEIEFAFDGTPWRDVIKWLADSADLALHMGDVPTGSFTYADSNSFTPQEAIDRVNLFLLPEGFTLIRSGRLLSLVNLSNRQSAQQLDALAKLVTVEELAKLEPFEVVKCLFPLGELKADDAVEELAGLNLMVPPATFPRTNQLLITDTAGKLRAANSILSAFAPSTMDNGTVVQGFPLEHVDAEDVLAVIRPHLGLATGEMIGIDVSLSSDTKGRSIFVTGVEDKIKLIEGLIKSVDVPENGSSTTDANAVLKSYPVAGGNLQTVYDVLQTLLAGKNVRLSADRDAEAIVALATPETHVEIEQTVTQLQAAEKSFEVITLNGVDPYFAISLIEQMLDLPDEFLDDPDTIDPDAPRIDADAANGRLFVRAKPKEIEEIKKIVAGLETEQASPEGVVETSNLQIYPVRGEAAVRLLKTAAPFWREENPVIFYPSVERSTIDVQERVVNPAGTAEVGLQKVPPKLSESPTAQYLTDNIRSQAAPVRCQLTMRGLLIQCDEPNVAARFVSHLKAIGGPAADAVSTPVVFYLKYTRPDDALKMLAELLDGGEAARESESGYLVNGYVGSSSYSMSIITSREGTMTMLNGTITVVADTRLNRLIAQGTAKDIELISGYLKIVDKDKSLTQIETYGRSHVIELAHTKAADVADAIREAYAGRVAASPKAMQAQAQQKGNQRQQSNAKANSAPNQPAANKGGKRDGENEAEAEQDPRLAAAGGGQAKNLEPLMTIAVHEPSNSLIVTAPEALFEEVEELAKLIDERSKQTVNVIRIPGSVPFDSLQKVLSGSSDSKGRRKSSPEPAGGL